ncbi:MAG: biopolymer transporter ExbD [Lentisphaerae bacterium]|nr:biopolymer transporter ExbD [Lentisphaerota bacterium]
MNFKRHIRDTSESFQMAPMIDIIFILLIHFMAATIFAQWENKLGIQVPAADSGVRTDRQPGEVIINIDSAGEIYINSQLISPERLEFLLQQIAATFKSQPVVIRADSETRHKAVIKVLDICRQADIWNVAFATLPKENTP